MKVLGGVMNMTPAKGLIALLVGGAYLIIDNWETVGPVIKKVWHVVDETAQAMGMGNCSESDCPVYGNQMGC
ncbi:hypothetical protein ACVXG9_03870 [Escherichia coli]